MIGGSYEDESKYDHEEWTSVFEKNAYFVATIDGKDVGILAIESFPPGVGDFGATCWLGGAWVHPQYRGIGVMRKLISLVDDHSESRDWRVQGLGVFVDNSSARTLWERLGFDAMGEVQPSTRKPGRYYQRMIRKSKSSS